MCIRDSYQLALNEDKTTIFENYCDFLNYFDSSISVQLSFINQQAVSYTHLSSGTVPVHDVSKSEIGGLAEI